MRSMGIGGFKRALIFLSIGLEPVIFAIVGWYAAPYLKISNTIGALIGVIMGFGLMFWSIWRLGLSAELKIQYEIESEKLRGLTSIIEVDRYKVLKRSDIMKIIGARGPIQLLNVLKEISLINKDFYDIDKLNEVTLDLVDFSHIIIEMRVKSPLEFVKILDGLSDFFILLAVNFAFKHEVESDPTAKAFALPPIPSREKVIDPKGLLSTNLKDLIASQEIRELYTQTLEEALSINSRAPLLALAAYSLALTCRDLGRLEYGKVYALKLKELADKLYSIATIELEKRGLRSGIVKKIRDRELLRIFQVEGQEVDVMRSFICEAHEALMRSGRIPLKAESIISYLFVKWCEKVSLNLAFMAARGEVDVPSAYSFSLLPL